MVKINIVIDRSILHICRDRMLTQFKDRVFSDCRSNKDDIVFLTNFDFIHIEQNLWG